LARYETGFWLHQRAPQTNPGPSGAPRRRRSSTVRRPPDSALLAAPARRKNAPGRACGGAAGAHLMAAYFALTSVAAPWHLLPPIGGAERGAAGHGEARMGRKAGLPQLWLTLLRSA